MLHKARTGLSRDAAESAGVHVTMARFLRQVALDVRAPDVTPGRQVALSAMAMVCFAYVLRHILALCSLPALLAHGDRMATFLGMQEDVC